MAEVVDRVETLLLLRPIWRIVLIRERPWDVCSVLRFHDNPEGMVGLNRERRWYCERIVSLELTIIGYIVTPELFERLPRGG